jgi:Fibronectin type III domain
MSQIESNTPPQQVPQRRWYRETTGAKTLRNRVARVVILLYALGTVAFGPAPAYAAATDPETAPTVTLTGQLIHVADETGSPVAAVRTPDKVLVPVEATVVQSLKSGTAVTLNVVVPARVRSVAMANGTLTVRRANGKRFSKRLHARDLAAATDGTPEPAKSDLGMATVASASSTGQALAVNAVVSAADPVGSYTPATRRLFVAVVTPRGWATPNAVTPAQITTQVTNASNYWSTVTSAGVKLVIDTITDPYTSAYDCSNPVGMWNEAVAKTGFAYAPNTSVVVKLPKDISRNSASQCGYGLGTIGDSVNDWGLAYVTDDAFPGLAHELGHNMSLLHADTLECPSASDSAYYGTSWTGTGCQEVSYGDGGDVMSASPTSFAPFLSSPQSLRTGIIPASAVTVIPTAGTTNVILSALGSRSGVRAAEVLDPTNNVTYYVEYRVPTAPDTADVHGEALGVRVLRFNPVDGTTVLLDPTPTSTPSTDRDATLRTGRTFTSYSGAVRVTTTSTTSNTATISITYGITSPSAPTGASATAGDGQAVVSWTAPDSSGGSAITGYTVTAAPGGMTVTTTGATTATAAGLTNGTSYTFAVTATNAKGTGPPVLSPAVTPGDQTAPVVVITGKPPALTASASATLSFSGTDATDPVGSLAYLCSLDGAAASVCTSPTAYTALSSAAHTFTVWVTDPAGNTGTATYSWRVDRVAPTVAMTAPAAVYALTTGLTSAWSARDVGGGLANVDVRYQRAPYNRGFSPAVYPSAWQKTTATKGILSGVAAANTYCFSARARDKAGNLSAWSAPRCSAVALDDRSMVASAGWSRVVSKLFYRSTATTTSRSAVTLTRTGVKAKRIYLVATRCRTCGVVGVYWNGALIKKVNLYRSTTTRRSVLGITAFTGVRSGTLKIRTLTRNKTVQIDGVALVRG